MPLLMLVGSLWGCSASPPVFVTREVPHVGELKVEQVGGFAGFGGPHLKSSGTLDLSTLSSNDRLAVEALFARTKAPAGSAGAATGGDQFRYRLTRGTASGTESIEASESEVPPAVKAIVSARIE
ncbi:MAG: hypothetical protein JWL71_4993 [Acidobacteria bacterium]|nr:hypothetical protein [Acidobacteriota bacterium]